MRDRFFRHLPLLLLAGAVLAPLVSPNDYVTGVLARICLYSLLALGLNVVVGFAGLLDLGYAAFFAIGAYTIAFLTSSDSPFLGVKAYSTSSLQPSWYLPRSRSWTAIRWGDSSGGAGRGFLLRT